MIDLQKVLGSPYPDEEQRKVAELGGPKDRLEKSVVSGLKNDPHAAAKAFKLSREANMPLDYVQRNEKDAEAISRARSIDFDKILKDAPRTADFLSNPDNASQAHTDIDILQTIETELRGSSDPSNPPGNKPFPKLDPFTRTKKDRGTFLSRTGDAFERGQVVDRLGLLGFEQMDDIDPQRAEEIQALKSRMQALTDEDIGGLEFAINSAAEIVGQMTEAVPEALKGAGYGAVAGGVQANVVMPPFTPPQARLAGTVGGAVRGGTVGGGLAMTNHAFKIEAGHAFVEMLDVTNEAGEKIEPSVAQGAAIAVGTVNAVLNSIGMVGSAMPFRDAAKSWTTKAVKDALKTKSGREIVLGFAGNYAKAWTAETSTEVLQEVVQMAGVELAKDLSEFDFENMSYEEYSETLKEIFTKVGSGMAILALPGASVNAGAQIRAKNRGMKDQERIDKLSKASAQSEFKKNNPEAYRELVKNIGEDANIPSVLLDSGPASEIFNQMDLTDAPAGIKAIAADIESALEAGRPVEIPIEIYASEIAGSAYEADLRPHIKLDIEALTMAESQNQDIQAEIRALSSMTAEQLSSEAQVYNDVYGQLISIGQDPGVASQQAMMYEAITSTLGKRTGMSAMEVYQRRGGGLNVSREISPELQQRANEISPTDIMVDRIRTGDIPQDQDIYGKSLVQFITERGGIRDDGGELASRDANEGRVGRNRIYSDNGRTMDDIAEAAVESGYITERDENLLMEMIDRELAGDPVYAMGAENAELQSARMGLDQLQEILDELQIDVSELTNQEVIQILTGGQPEQTSNVFEQAQAMGYAGDSMVEAGQWLQAAAKGLDMSTEARMQRAQMLGFDTEAVYYHETDAANVDGILYRGGFDITNPASEDVGAGVVLQSQAAEATDSVAQIPVYTRATQNIIDINGLAQLAIDNIDMMGALNAISQLDIDLQAAIDVASNLDIVSLTDYAEQILNLWQADTSPEIAAIRDQMTDVLKQNGYDGITIADSQVVFNPENVRSINAAFDPDMATAKDLMAQPDGDALPMNIRGQNFRTWFMNSKAVDERGDPVVVYHGTSQDISEMNTDGRGKTAETGAFFSSSPAVANTYANGRNGGNLMPAYLSLQNPLIVDAGGVFWNQLGFDVELTTTDETLRLGDLFPAELAEGSLFSTDDLARWAKQQGYDGLIVDNVVDVGPYGMMMTAEAKDPSTIYVAFNPEQIKSATGNNGNFSRQSPNILEQSDRANLMQWFGNSVVTDQSGQPRVLYHGTQANIEDSFVFDYSRIGDNGRMEGAGFYFTGNRQVAQGYAGNDGSLIEAYLKIENPLAYESPAFDEATTRQIIERAIEIESTVNEMDIEDGFLSNFGDARFEGMDSVLDRAVELLTSDETALDQLGGIVGSGMDPEHINRAVMEVTGHDGFIIDGFDGMDTGTENAGNNEIFVVFTPEQVKSVDNTGDFSDSPDIFYQFAGENAATADRFSLQTAKERIANGDFAGTVRRETGWFKGTDSKWRFEIPDNEAELIREPSEGIYLLSDLMRHDKLYAAYPEIAGMYVFISPEVESQGVYYADGNRIELNSSFPDEGKLSTLLHEVQHAIQDRENFARGGSSDIDFTRSVQNALEQMAKRNFEAVSRWSAMNLTLTSRARYTADLARMASVYESATRLIEHSRRDKPSSVLRNIRNETQWLVSDVANSNESIRERARDLERKFYELPKPSRMNERNAFLRNYAFDVAMLLQDAIPGEMLDAFRSDPRQVKSMVAALEREASKAREKTKPLTELQERSRQSDQLASVTSYKTPYQVYRALGGEVEARNTQARQAMTAEERVNTSPEMTADVNESENIVLFGDGQITLPAPNSVAPPEPPRNLYVAHNITAVGVRKAFELGGLAAPSLAISNIDTVGAFGSFGDITLLAEPELLNDPKIRTFDADVYTTRQPRAVYKINFKAYNKLRDDLDALPGNQDYPDSDSLGRDPEGEMARSFAVKMLYLEETGQMPRIPREKETALTKAAMKAGSRSTYTIMQEPAFIKAVAAKNRAELKKMDDAEMRQEMTPVFFEDAEMQIPTESVLRDEANRAARYVNNGGVDRLKLSNMVGRKFRTAKANQQFEEWISGKLSEIVSDPMIFKGFTASGNRRYVPYNLANVVKEMTIKIQGGEGFNYGAGSVRATTATELKSLAAIQKKRDNIVSADNMDAHKEKSQQKLVDLLDYLQPYYKFEATGFGYMDDASSAIAEGPRGWREAFNLDAEATQEIRDYLDYLKELPTEYFEAKAARGVQFREFSAAIIPSNTPADVKKILADAGLTVKTYKDGDTASREKAVRSFNDLLFQQGDDGKPSKRQPRGYFDRAANRITLTPRANLSTFLHESGHFFFEVMRDLASENESIAVDLEKFEKWANKSGAKTDRELHEAFASSFEAYLMEGKAPVAELQPMFSRFKSWLALVYRNIQKVFSSNSMEGYELSDEVRGVMDRLFATEEAIDQAISETGVLGPNEMEALGLTPDEAIRYQRMVNEARDEANTSLTTDIMREMMRERTKWWAEQIKAQSAIVEDELNQLPEYQARDYLSGDRLPEGANPAKLDRDYITAIYGKAPAKKLTRMSAKQGGLRPDALAGTFGYRNGDEMVRALLGTMNKSDRENYIRKEAEQRVRDLHGDMLTDGTIDEKAKTAVSNDKRAELLLAELRWLNRASKTKETPRQYFKSAAEITIAETPVQNIRPDIHRRNEVKARNDALKAAAKEDFRAAAMHQHQAVRQFYLYREAVKAKEQAEKHRNRLSQMGKVKYSTRDVDPNYIQQLKVLIAAYDFRKNPQNTNSRLEGVRRFIAAQKETNPDLIADTILDSIVSWKDMTLEDLTALRDAAENILHVGKANGDLAKADFEAKKLGLLESIQDNTDKPKPRNDARSGINKVRRGKAQFAALHRKLESLLQELDGWQDTGQAQELIFRPLYEAQINEMVRVELEHNELKDIFDGYEYLFKGLTENLKDLNDTTKKLVDTYEMPVGDKGMKLSLTRGDRIVLALNWGNEGNREALRKQHRMQMSDQTVTQAISTLTKEELQLVNKLWAYVDKFYPELAAVEQKATGVAPQKVEASPFVVNGVEMRGGYYPLQADSAISWSQEMHDVEERAKKMMQGGSMRASTKHGSTIERTEFGGKVVSLSIDGLFKHVDGVVHDITHREAVRSIDGLVRSRPIREAMIDKLGQENVKQISAAITRLAGGNVHPADFAIMDKLFRFSRTAVSYGAMGYSVGTALLNFTGIFPAIAETGKIRLLSSLFKQMANPVAMGNEIAELSSFMANRAQTINRDLYAILRGIKTNSTWDQFKQYAFWMIQKVDGMVTRSVWDAAYNKALEQNYSETDAVFQADRTVARTQGTGLKIDLSQIEDGNELIRAMSPMYTYFNAVLNLAIRQGGKRKTGQISNLKYAENMFWIFVATAMAEVFFRAPEDEEGDAPERYSKALGGYYLGQWFGIRELSSFVVYGSMFETPFQNVLVAPAAFATEGYQLMVDEDAEIDKGTVRAATSLMPMLGFPSGLQINRTISYLMDIEESGEDVSLYKMLVTGKEEDTDLEKLFISED